MLPAEFRQFAQALCDPEAALPAIVQSPGVSLAERFAVYRNNVHASLVDALAEQFPIVLALTGNEFFRAMARVYVQRHKPGSELLHEYGVDMPGFIADFAPANGLPYLGDVARLEIAWSQSWAAQDAAPLQLGSLAALSAAALAMATVLPHPAARLITSAWPVGSIWQAHQLANPDLSGIQWQAQNVLITRPQAHIQLQQLPDGVTHFATALLQRRTIADAAASALAASPQLDIGASLGALIDCGAIMEIIPT
jgi:hypothetical protein